MIHVCFCFRDKTGCYAKFAGTSMLSVFENTDSEVTVHILHDDTLTPDNRDKFSYLAGRYAQAVKFYNVEKLCADKIEEIKNLIPNVDKTAATVGAFYKVLIPQVLPKEIDKAIFLDPDTLVNLDINELWQVDLGANCLGVVTEKANGVNANKNFLLCSEGVVNAADYFNCGVLLMNLNLLRKEERTIMHGVKFRGKNPLHKYLEQTALNYCFHDRALKLPKKFNSFIRRERSSDKPALSEKIYHYAGGTSRPGFDMNDPFNRLWMNCFIKSPWFDEETFERLYKIIQTANVDQENSPLNIVNTMPGKVRAFFVEPEKISDAKNLFDIKDYEEIIPAENDASLRKLIDTMKICRGTCVFFIMTEKFLGKNFPFELLIKEGFEEEKDFFRGWTFTSKTRSVSFDSYSLISAM